ncbi:MAG TPA: 2-amino-4-hydroxy-6-hydroxymethyldihydropteridine diphosphokinase [Candidatus Cybelea sp.]|jgi:2-amino-4-hydroxy-6-hydroxymethyldihydropteridine diphosphokinase|nr:2-amino-4-hydroxy-6-hydroxymethyldihydropteridine diphosphokinase [Candidatus Cybelea sp.]
MDNQAHEIAFVGLGSNLGDSVEIVRRAFGRLQRLSDAPLLRSSLWRSTPVDCPPGTPLFVNAMAGLRPRADQTPQSLLRQLQILEVEFGRSRGSVPNEPRLLDLDLIAFGARTVNSSELVLPHPRAHRRRFVLQPLAEIAPEFVLPGQGRGAADLLRELSSMETLVKLE